MSNIITHSQLTCPECGHREVIKMPTDYCQWYYECVACKRLITPHKGHCCVFFSYGSVLCPPIQQGAQGSSTKYPHQVSPPKECG